MLKYLATGNEIDDLRWQEALVAKLVHGYPLEGLFRVADLVYRIQRKIFWPVETKVEPHLLVDQAI